MKIYSILLCSIILIFSSCQKTTNKVSLDQKIYQRVDSLMALMTLEEKIGQLNCLQGKYNTTAYEVENDLFKEIKQGRVGSITDANNLEAKILWQKAAVNESRLGIPLLFNSDVIHGFRTIFPIPIGQAASWDLDAIEKAERISSLEASREGIHWTFAPMVDIARDPRWGRVMEGAGEDTYLGSLIAAARIRGIQGNLGDPGTLMSCIKHYAAYGAAEGGREYNTVDMSELVLREVYLPPFKAAIDENAATIMNSFNVLNRIPASSNDLLVKQILKKEWGYQGFTVSDAFSFYELIPHGYAKDSLEAAELCINACSDVDLWSKIYMNCLPELIEKDVIKESQVDEAARRVLYYKFKIGLMDNPFLNLENSTINTVLDSAHTEASRDIARKTFVLLKNENQLLPLSKETKNIAVIGWLGNSIENRNYMGTWSANGDPKDIINLIDGIKKIAPSVNVTYAKGCEAYGYTNEGLIKEAVKVAKKADIVILAIGEEGRMSGECASRTDISLPNNQEDLVKAIHATGKPIVATIFAGRPLTFEWTAKHIPSILYVWQPGTMGGVAIADVLFGDYIPSGKLPMTFPLSVGQVPIYYNQLNTGRPRLGSEDTRWGVSKWSDSPNEPLFPFGFGLSYTTFEYSNLKVLSNTISTIDTLEITVDVTNTGKFEGEEVVQLYIQDIAGSVARPIKELKRFEKISLQKGEKKTVHFYLTANDLRFWNIDMEYKYEAGNFNVYVGTNSDEVLEGKFELKY